jgi:hypothetical protein
MESDGLTDTLGDKHASSSDALGSTANYMLAHACRLYSHVPGCKPSTPKVRHSAPMC